MRTNNRLIRILQYFEKNEKTTYSELSKALFLSEDVVRYEVDSLNFYLDVLNFPKIKSDNKGNLITKELDSVKIMNHLLKIYKPSKPERIEYLTYKLVN